MDVLRICCVISTNFIRQFLVIADSEPAFLSIGCAVFQQVVKIFDVCLGELAQRVVDYVVNCPEMIRSLDDIIDIHSGIGNAYCIGFENISCLVVSQAAAFNMIRFICEDIFHL